MINRILLSGAAGLAFAMATPVTAQDSEPPVAYDDAGSEGASGPSAAQMEQFMGMFAGLFQTEPLTPEQESRLPKARGVVTTMMPEGFYAEMMSDMMDGVMKPMMAALSGETGANLMLSQRIDTAPENLEALSADSKVELASILDPGFAQRGELVQNMLGDIMAQTAVAVEPAFREGLTRAYAVRFSDTQLDDISAFFGTPTGMIYAQENMKLMSDPQVMSASMQAMPAMMSQLGNMEERMTQAMAELPAERTFDDLSVQERERISQLTGIAEADLEQAIRPPKGN